MNTICTRRLLIKSGELQLQVVERGDPAAKGILFIHGFGQSHESFHRQLESDVLSPYHLVAFDLRGHGGSDKPRAERAYQVSDAWARDVAAVLEATCLKKPTIVAWSYGGYVVADYVRHYGVENVAALNLVGSGAGLISLPSASAVDTPRSLIPKDNLDLLELVRFGKEAAREFACEEMTDDERDLLFATEMMMPSYVRTAILARDLNNSDIGARLTRPVLISCGTNDTFLSAQMAEVLAASLPCATVSAYAGAGHLPFIQCTSRFNAELSKFVSDR